MNDLGLHIKNQRTMCTYILVLLDLQTSYFYIAGVTSSVFFYEKKEGTNSTRKTTFGKSLIMNQGKIIMLLN